MKRKHKAPKWFVELYNEIITGSDDISNFLASKTGYSCEWCNQNINRAFELLKDKDRKIANDMFVKVEATKKYLWVKYSYKNWDKVKDVITSPFAKTSYDIDTQIITISDATKIKKAISNMEKQLKKFL